MTVKERLQAREKWIKEVFAKLYRQTDAGYFGQDSETLREKLEKFCVGRGLDICAGDFPMGDSIGVDVDRRKLGAHYWIRGDELTPFKSNELDYVVTNYFDCFPNPLHTLQEWGRVLRSGGTVAFAVCDSKKYKGVEGPLSNHNRLSAHTEETIRFLLGRAEYKNINIEQVETHLVVNAIKS